MNVDIQEFIDTEIGAELRTTKTQMLLLLNSKSTMYSGTVTTAEKEKRRKKNKVAHKARKANR